MWSVMNDFSIAKRRPTTSVADDDGAIDHDAISAAEELAIMRLFEGAMWVRGLVYWMLMVLDEFDQKLQGFKIRRRPHDDR